MSEPLWVSVELALDIHAEQLALFGGPEGIRDRGLLESALARAPNGPGAVAAAVATAAATGHATKEERIAAGKALFAGTCSTCHAPDGKGMSGVFPPLAASDYLAKNPGKLPEIILHGLQGKVTVNGKDYNSIMPPMAQLTDDEVANIGTYVLNSFGNKGGEVTRDDAKKARAAKPADAAAAH